MLRYILTCLLSVKFFVSAAESLPNDKPAVIEKTGVNSTTSKKTRSSPLGLKRISWNDSDMDISILYWRALENGLDNDVGFPYMDKNLWDIGVRLSLNQNVIQKGWSARTDWTYLNINASGNLGNGNISKWNLKLNTLNISLGYSFNLNRRFIVKPFIGLSATQIDERLQTHYLSTISSTTSTDSLIQNQNDKNTLKGIGPKAGIDANLALGCGFGSYGKLGISILYGKYYVKFDESQQYLNPEETFFLNDTQNLFASQQVFEAAVGMYWKRCFHANATLNLKLGWEHYAYINFNQIGSPGDLYLDGLTFSAGFEF